MDEGFPSKANKRTICKCGEHIANGENPHFFFVVSYIDRSPFLGEKFCFECPYTFKVIKPTGVVANHTQPFIRSMGQGSESVGDAGASLLGQ
jgi:hypothetical protein